MNKILEQAKAVRAEMDGLKVKIEEIRAQLETLSEAPTAEELEAFRAAIELIVAE